jgi:hypothetical protein
MAIPLYGFLQGDTMVLLIFADEHESMASLARKLQQAAIVRVAPRSGSDLYIRYKGWILDPKQTVSDAGMQPLDRFDGVCEEV